MNNLGRYNQAFIDTFAVREEDLEGLSYQAVEAWDSVGHMQLVAALEDTFDIMFDTDDIINFDSYEKGKEYMEKYGVEL